MIDSKRTRVQTIVLYIHSGVKRGVANQRVARHISIRNRRQLSNFTFNSNVEMKENQLFILLAYSHVWFSRNSSLSLLSLDSKLKSRLEWNWNFQRRQTLGRRSSPAGQLHKSCNNKIQKRFGSSHQAHFTPPLSAFLLNLSC